MPGPVSKWALVLKLDMTALLMGGTVPTWKEEFFARAEVAAEDCVTEAVVEALLMGRTMFLLLQSSLSEHLFKVEVSCFRTNALLK